MILERMVGCQLEGLSSDGELQGKLIDLGFNLGCSVDDLTFNNTGCFRVVVSELACAALQD